MNSTNPRIKSRGRHSNRRHLNLTQTNTVRKQTEFYCLQVIFSKQSGSSRQPHGIQSLISDKRDSVTDSKCRWRRRSWLQSTCRRPNIQKETQSDYQRKGRGHIKGLHRHLKKKKSQAETSTTPKQQAWRQTASGK